MDSSAVNTKILENLRKLDVYFDCENPSCEWLSIKANHNLGRVDINAAHVLRIPQGELDPLKRIHLKQHCPNIEVPGFSDPLVARYGRTDNLWICKRRIEATSGTRKKTRHQPETRMDAHDRMSVPQYLDQPIDPSQDQITVNTSYKALTSKETPLIPVTKHNPERQSIPAKRVFAQKMRDEKKLINDQANVKIYRLWETNEREKQSIRDKAEQEMKVMREKMKAEAEQEMEVMREKMNAKAEQEMEVMHCNPNISCCS